MDKDGLLGLGLSRLIRYSYGGFLAIIIAADFSKVKTEALINALGPVLTPLCAIVVGAVIYVVHRGTVIPLHHLGLCGLYRLYDSYLEKRNPSHSTSSPTRYLNKCIGVGRGRRMLAYSIIRGSGFFEDENELNIAHAVHGLPIMTGTGMLVAGILSIYCTPIIGNAGIFFSLSLGLYLIAYANAFAQHSAECWRLKRGEEKIREIVKEAGII